MRIQSGEGEELLFAFTYFVFYESELYTFLAVVCEKSICSEDKMLLNSFHMFHHLI